MICRYRKATMLFHYFALNESTIQPGNGPLPSPVENTLDSKIIATNKYWGLKQAGMKSGQDLQGPAGGAKVDDTG
jgi:hypothetical protein